MWFGLQVASPSFILHLNAILFPPPRNPCRFVTPQTHLISLPVYAAHRCYRLLTFRCAELRVAALLLTFSCAVLRATVSCRPSLRCTKCHCPSSLTFSLGPQVQLASLCICVTISATVALLCLFTPKLYIVIFQPYKNVRQTSASNQARSGGGGVKGLGEAARSNPVLLEVGLSR